MKWHFRSYLVVFVILLLALVVSTRIADSQQPSRPIRSRSRPPSSPGMNTGGVHAPVKDTHSRPITAGGFVDGAPSFSSTSPNNPASKQFHHRSGTLEKTSIIRCPGFRRSSGRLRQRRLAGYLSPERFDRPGHEREGAWPRAMLFHNNHDGTFTDVTGKAGVGTSAGVSA